MQRIITLPTAATVVGGLALGIALHVAGSQPYRPTTSHVQLPPIHACGAGPMDWSISKASSCALFTAGSASNRAEDDVKSAIAQANDLVVGVGNLASNGVQVAAETVVTTIDNAGDAVERTVDNTIDTASDATQLAGRVVSNSVSAATSTVSAATGTVLDVSSEAISVANDVAGQAVNVIGNTVDLADETVDQADAAVDCVIGLELMTLSGNGVVGCAS